MTVQVAMLAAVPFIMVLGNSMLIPVLPAMQRALDASKFEVGLFITFFSLPAGITIPLAGFLSDRIGRKKVMAPALVIYGLGGLVAGISAVLLGGNAYAMVMAGRVIQGIGAGGTYQLAMALTGDIFQSRERTKALGLLEAANGLGKVISPVAGAAFALITWYTPFFVYGLLAVPIAAGVWFLVREPQEEKKSGEKKPAAAYFGAVGKVFREKGAGLVVAFLAGMAGLLILFGVLSWFSDVLEQRYDIEGFSKGLIIAIPVLFMAITSYVSGTLLQKKLARWTKGLVVGGLALVTGGLAVTAWVTGLVPLLAALSGIGVGNGLVLPGLNTLITSAASTAQRGIVTAIYGTVRFFGVAIGPPAFNMVDRLGRQPLFLGAAAATGVILALAAWLISPQKLLPRELLGGGPQRYQPEQPQKEENKLV